MRRAATLLLVLLAGCQKRQDAAQERKPAPAVDAAATAPEAALPAVPLGLFPPPPPPADNPQTPARIALGRQLFFDKRLAKDGAMACEGCHRHELGWTDGEVLSTRVGGAKNTRHTPTLYNVAYLSAWSWDGRSPTLEAQVAAMWQEQLGADPAAVATALAAVPGYAAGFQQVFGAPPSADNIPQALAAYVRTLLAGNSPWDRYESGDKLAVSSDVIEGYKIFTARAQCVLCHMPPLYTDGMFHNVGLEAGKGKPDPGRARVSGQPQDTRAFKTPTLRGVARSAPYFHDGSRATLKDAVTYMAAGGQPDPHLDPRLRKVELSAREIQQLVAFLEALTPGDKLERPSLP